MTRWMRSAWGFAAIAATMFEGACGSAPGGLQEVQRVRSGDLNIVLLADDGELNKGKESFVVEFRKVDGTLADAGTVMTNASMPMPGMTMSGNVQVERADVQGRYRATGEFGMAGGWQMKVEWNGPAGRGSVSFDGTVQ